MLSIRVLSHLWCHTVMFVCNMTRKSTICGQFGIYWLGNIQCKPEDKCIILKSSQNVVFYLVNCLLLLMLLVQITLRARCTTYLFDKACQWLAAGRWFSPDTPTSSTNKTDCHNITEILLKVALNTIKPKT